MRQRVNTLAALLFKPVVLGALIAGVLASPALLESKPAAAAAGQWHILSRIATGCNNGESGFAVQFNLVPGATYTADTLVAVDGLIYMDEVVTSTAPGPFDNDWFIFDINSRGLKTGTWPLPPRLARALFTLRDNTGAPIWHVAVEFVCNQGGMTIIDEGEGAGAPDFLKEGSTSPNRTNVGGAVGAVGAAAAGQAQENRARVAAAAAAGSNAAVTAPRTGTGIAPSVTPPNTGDAGLAGGKASPSAGLVSAVALVAAAGGVALRRRLTP